MILDPADGSSNIDINVSVGTIFGVYADEEDRKPDFVRKVGRNFKRYFLKLEKAENYYFKKFLIKILFNYYF